MLTMVILPSLALIVSSLCSDPSHLAVRPVIVGILSMTNNDAIIADGLKLYGPLAICHGNCATKTQKKIEYETRC